MNQPRVVHLKKEPYDVRIDRSSIWGNPFKVGVDGTREEVIQLYKEDLLNNKYLMSRIGELKGKTLGCWCAPAPCHGDVLLELANEN